MGDQRIFQDGNLVWAKMKGFPMWPAKVIGNQSAPSKYCVSFFGSRETAFVKGADVCDYFENRLIYEQKKNKRQDFLLAVKEIRKEAGLPPMETEEDEPPAVEMCETVPTAIDAPTSSSSFGRVRKPSHRIADKDFVSNAGSRRRRNSNSISFDLGVFDRPRTDSNGSIFGSRRFKGPSITDEFGNFDINNAGQLLQGDLGLSDHFDSDGGATAHVDPTRRRRRTTSKFLDDILYGRDRNFSTSSDFKGDPNGLMDIFESAGALLDERSFYDIIDQLPSEESDRPQTPENVGPMPSQNHLCTECLQPQKYIEMKWTCFNPTCSSASSTMKAEQMDDLESFFDGQQSTAKEPSVFTHKTTKRTKKRNDPPPSVITTDPNIQLQIPKKGRPRSYKVEKTPPVQANGVRLCIFCNGHVRPQMCGGNKHRWRCVDKRCRKWYGWVRSNEEIPKDLGKKGRWKDLVLKVQGHTEDGKLVQMIPPPDDSPEIKPEEKVKRKKKKVPTIVQRPLSPIDEDRVNYQPSQLELRAHWWRPDRKRTEPSPDRAFTPTTVDIAAALRIAEQSTRAGSIITKSLVAAGHEEVDSGTSGGCIDIMMDTMFGVIGSTMSLACNLPYVNQMDPELPTRLFTSMEQMPLLNP